MTAVSSGRALGDLADGLGAGQQLLELARLDSTRSVPASAGAGPGGVGEVVPGEEDLHLGVLRDRR
jgi:hypothetical protein